MDTPSLRISQFGQASLLGTFFDNLPGTMTIDVKNEETTVLDDWSATLDIFHEHDQSLPVDGQCPLPTILTLVGYSLADSPTATGAERVAPSDS